MTEAEKIKLSAEWNRLHREKDKAENAGEMRVAGSFEQSIAKLEEKLNRHDVDPRDYL